ncbi:MAG: 1-acyl-sn-glycerol-3-phosphate acyltransferase [Ardenticatenaceae bacterium]|nr:1-acyl-sn-glycerol-3-phosphate acyltransferase [Ardenticatenaceae bacterium]MCB8986231.1 1-acyl-sn-glycerol-3-phosphate acyltransferase [Ardenticatenaceae bacterium]
MLFRYRLIRLAMHVVRTILLARIKVIGREHIPAERPYIVVLNHTSVVDTPVLLITFPLQQWRFFAVEKWRYHPVFGPIMAWLGAIYISRGEADRQSLREAMAAIADGTVFGLAPEGTRSYSGELMAAKDGAAFLAHRANVPIVPVGLVHCDKLFHNFKHLRPTTLEVHIGRPFTLPAADERVRAKDLPAYTHYIMVHIAALLPASYHGYYADSPALAALLAGEDPWPVCEEL